MCRAKRIVLSFASLIFLVALLCQAASAIELSPRASLYLNSYGASMYKGSTAGNVRVEFTVLATEHSDYVGVSELIIYKSNGTRAATVRGTVGNGLLCDDTQVHIGHYDYYGVPGTSYYAILTMYAERDGGSDSKTYITNTVTAPS
jgi:hypothetical protein